MRRFGANRPDGRKHAGCDLYAPVGTKIYAMADGTIVDHRSYYLDTYQITVNHGDFIARCGEVKPNGERLATGLQVRIPGKKRSTYRLCWPVSVSEREHYVDVHLEIYSDATNNSIYRAASSLPYQRRADLVDPTPYLDRASENLP